MSRKVLIITYYWPPAGGIAVQRMLKFSKYLPSFGWTPVIYTVSNGEFPEIDAALLKEVPADMEVIKTKIWEPYSIYKLLTGKKSKERVQRVKAAGKPSKMESLSQWIRGNFFIPDTRFLWIRPSVSFLKKRLQQEKFDAIISTGPPHSNHMIALALAKSEGIPWIADFRDPWTTMDYFKDFTLTGYANRKHHRLELDVLHKASAVVVVGSSMKREFEEKGSPHVEIIHNGFDDADFAAIGDIELDNKFSIVHVGSFFKRRNPDVLWKALAQLKTENHPLLDHLEIKLIGRVDQVVLDSISKNQLDQYLNLISFIPHAEAIRHLKSAQVLLLPIDNFEGSKWVLTGKLFEYLATRRPILCIGPSDGDAAALLEEVKAGETFDYDNHQAVVSYLKKQFELYQAGKLGSNTAGNVDMYSRRELTKKLANLLNEISQ